MVSRPERLDDGASGHDNVGLSGQHRDSLSVMGAELSPMIDELVPMLAGDPTLS